MGMVLQKPSLHDYTTSAGSDEKQDTAAVDVFLVGSGIELGDEGMGGYGLVRKPSGEEDITPV